MKIIKFAQISVFSIFFAACTADKPTVSNTSPSTAPTTAASSPIALTDEFASAKANFSKQKCVVCHQENGEGGKNIMYGDIAIDEVPSFKNPKIAAEPDAEYVKKIERGGDGMPKYKDKLTSEEINALVRYIRREFQDK